MSDVQSPGLAAKLDSIDVVFGGRTVLEKFSLDVADGEFLVLIGRSGCGKTTVLNALTGFVPPTRGTVRVLGGDPVRMRDRVGYMFARDALLPWRSAVRNVEFGLELERMPRKERRRRALDRLTSLGLEDHSSLLPSQLSQGMRQRVALARTWVTEPDLLLMDEPFAALDAQTRVAVQEEFLRTWQSRKVPVVFVTHDLTEAIIMADRIVVISEGRVSDDVRVSLPRPRHLEELVNDERYQKILKDLTEAI